MDLTSENVYSLFCDSRFLIGEDQEIFMLGEGIYNPYTFHPGRLLSHREDIESMVAQLPAQFKQSRGGYSYEYMDIHADGHPWWLKGKNGNPEQLLTMGLALRLVEYLTPRDMWFLLPNGAPYIVVNDTVASAAPLSA